MFKSVALRTTAASALLAITSTISHAGDWQGFYAGASVATSFSSVNGAYDSSDSTGPFSLSPLESKEFGGQVFAGYLFHGASQFAFGPELSYSHLDIGNTMSTTEPPDRGPDIVTLSTDNMWQARLRGGVVNGNQFFYAAAGYAQMDYTTTIFNAINGGSTEAAGSDTGGLTLGLGVEMKVGDNMRLRAEVSHVFLDESQNLEPFGDGDPGDALNIDGVTLINIGAMWAF